MNAQRLMSYLLGLAVLTCGAAAQAAVQVGSVSDSRIGTSWTLDGSSMTNAREKLLNAANFGSGGTYGEALRITDSTATIDEAVLANFDVFFIGWVPDGVLGATELAAMSTWVERGGVMVITCDDTAHDDVCAHFGYEASNSATTPTVPTPDGAASPVFDGAFGAPSAVEMWGNVGFFSDPTGASVLGEDSASPANATVLYQAIGEGHALFVADVDMLSNNTVSAGDAIANDNDRFLANLFAYAATLGTQAKIHVGGISESRSTSWALEGGSMTTTRAKLLDVDNFGPGGTYGTGLRISDTAEPIDATVLADYDVFFIGWVPDGVLGAPELTALSDWVESGGVMIITCDDASHDDVCAHFGHEAANSATPPTVPTPEGSATPLFDGAFGTPASLDMAGNLGYFADATGASVFAVDATSPANATILYKEIGDGYAILLSDVCMISNVTLSAGSEISVSDDNDQFTGNLFAYAATLATVSTGSGGGGTGVSSNGGGGGGGSLDLLSLLLALLVAVYALAIGRLQR